MDKDGADVGEEGESGFVGGGGLVFGQGSEGFDGEGGPIATGDLGDGKEGAPIVAEAVIGGRWQDRVAGFEGGEVVLSPASEFAGKDGFDFGFVWVEVLGDFAGFGGDKRNGDGAVEEGSGERPDAGQGGGREGFVGTNTVVFAPAPDGAGGGFVSGVEKAAEFFGLEDVAVDFIEEQSGLKLVDETEENGSSEVFGAERSGDEASDDIEGGGFARAVFWGSKIQARTEAKGLKRVGVSTP